MSGVAAVVGTAGLHGANGASSAPSPMRVNPSLPQATMPGRPIVLKFGGTSLGTLRRIRRAALRIRHHRRAGRGVVVVASAAGHATARILASLDELGAPGAASAAVVARERDRALATGEDRTSALLAAALGALGVPALSLRGGEAGVYGYGAHGAGELQRVRVERLCTLLAAGVVPVVAGFQAKREDGETLTLGRGASDLTAVAIAAALDADECHIVTDVDGVYDADPRFVPDARLHNVLTHDALVRIVENGACVVHVGAAR
jgi:aspartate kinase